MKKQLLFISASFLSAAIATAAEELITLDLTKATTPLEFNPANGSWTDTYNDDTTTIESQCFSFVHNSIGEWSTWWGFTASNSADNARYEDTMTHQWSNMAKGGIVLNENGTVKTDDFGAPVVSGEVPYLVSYYGTYFSERPVDMVFNDGKSYEPQGVYLNLTSYPYYCIEMGDAYARAFTNGDSFTLTIHGVAADESEKAIEVELASYSNGDLTIARGWKYVDLTSLGLVNELYFTMESTDSGNYGMNTPGYFCLDKLTVKSSDNSVNGIASASNVDIRYDQVSKIATVNGADFAIVRNAAGQNVMSGESGSFDLSQLPAGVYMISAGNTTRKIAK